MRDKIGTISQIALAVGIIVLAVACIHKLREGRSQGPETVVKTVVDTLVIRDTIRITQPVPVTVRVRDTIRVPVTVPGKTDTVWAQLPREEKIYQDSTFRAVVSGPALSEEYGPRLDSIQVYSRTTIQYQTKTVYVEPSRWSIGIQAGYGASKDGLTPYLGVGVQYRLWAPKRRKAPP